MLTQHYRQSSVTAHLLTQAEIHNAFTRAKSCCPVNSSCGSWVLLSYMKSSWWFWRLQHHLWSLIWWLQNLKENNSAILTSSSLSLRLVLAGSGETLDQMNVQYCTETSLLPQSTKNFQGKLCFTSFKAWSYYCSLKRQEYRKTGQFKSLDPGLFSHLFSLLCRLQPTCPISFLTDPLNMGTVPVLQGGKTRTEKNIYYHGTQ